MNIEKIKQKILDLDKKKRIKFIVLFGSYAAGKQTPFSDIDIAVYYDENKEERFRFRLHAWGELPDNIDLQVFQDSPLPVKKEILSGKVLYYEDYQFTFDQFMAVIKEFSSFEKYYLEYLSQLEKELEA